MRIALERGIAGGENPTTFVIVLCPASIIVLQIVNVEIPGGWIEIMLTKLVR